MFRRRKSLIVRKSVPLNRRAFLGAAAAAVGGALVGMRTAAGQRSRVRVTREAPVILRVEFDPLAPPYGMPSLTPPEAGVCRTTFELDAGVTYSAQRLSRTASRITVDGLDIVTRVRFDIFTALNTPPKLLAHEEGHRAIGEHYYEDAATIAEEIGGLLIGKTFDGVGADQEAARRDAFNQVVASIERGYMARVRTPSAAANERFDEITKHGLDAIDEAEAVSLAIASTDAR
jgi:hypothetical protein